MNSEVVVTGATGFIGRHFVFELLRRADRRVTLIVRGTELEAAKARLLSGLSQVAKELGEAFDAAHAERALRVLVGDLTQPNCGVDPRAVPRPERGVSVEFWHIAASLAFEERNAPAIHAANVSGTEHAIELARALGAQRFVHVSTAYVCGSSRGTIAEELQPLDGGFNNAYEHSKCIAEHRVRELCTAAGLDYRILRPSIVVGLSSSYSASGSDSGLYGFVRECRRLRRGLLRSGRPIRVLAERDAPLNFIPVDQVVTEMMDLLEEGFPNGPVYHLTAESCPTVGETLDAICDALEMPRFDLVSRLDNEVTGLETMLQRRITFYGSYLTGTKRFTRARSAGVTVDARAIERYVASHLARPCEPPELVPLSARDGFPLRVVDISPDKRTAVVLVNAMGMPRAALATLESVLGAEYRVLTWQSRGVPSVEGELDGERAHFARHIDDLEDLLASQRVERAHLVGWCTGADVALGFACRAPERVLSLVCMNGPFLGLSDARTSYQHDLSRIVRGASKSLEHAKLYHGLIVEMLSGVPETTAYGEERSQIGAALSVLDPGLTHITGAPLRSPESFFRYARLLEHYLEEAPRDLPIPRVRSLLVTAEDDPIAHCDASREVAALLGAELEVRPSGGHFGPCKDERLMRGVANFIGRTPIPRTPLVPARSIRPYAALAVQYKE